MDRPAPPAPLRLPPPLDPPWQALKAAEREAIVCAVERHLQGALTDLEELCEVEGWDTELVELRGLTARLRCRRSEIADEARQLRARAADR